MLKYLLKNADKIQKCNYDLFKKAGTELKKVYGVVLIVLAMALTGCVSMVELTEEQHDQMAQYAAGVLLKHDKTYSEKLATPTPTPEATATPTPAPATSTPTPTEAASTPEPTQGGSSSSSGNETALAELKDIIGTEGIELSYGGYDMYESYVFDSYSVEPATAGELLMIVKIDVINTTDSDIAINLTDKGLSYRLYLDGGEYITPKWTILLNDFTTLNTTITGGQTFGSVLVFEVARDLNPSKLNLFIMQDDKTVIVELK